jgi:hypothetical protein
VFAPKGDCLILALLGLLAGIFMLWVFGRTSNQAAIRRARRTMQARLYELRLFTDEPALVWRAQLGLLAPTMRYLGLMLVPVLILTPPMAVAYVFLQSYYGLSPLVPGRESIVTVQLNRALDLNAAAPRLEAPAAIAVETGAVRVPSERQISWRIRPLQAVSGSLRVVLPGEVLEKTVAAGYGGRYLSDLRASSWVDFLEHPAEARLPAGPAAWISVRYPSAALRCFGVRISWPIYVLFFSVVSALLFKRRFGVSF